MVSPQNPLKSSSELLDDEKRLAIARKALEGNPRIKACDYEFHLSKPSYTWNTLQALSKDYPDYTFVLLIGGDNWERFDQWVHHDDIVANYEIAIYPRRGSEIDRTNLPNNVTIIDTPLLDISSTEVREKIARGESIDDLVPCPEEVKRMWNVECGMWNEHPVGVDEFKNEKLTGNNSTINNSTFGQSPNSVNIQHSTFNILQKLIKLLQLPFLPIKANLVFFIFMYLLAYVTYRLEMLQTDDMEERCALAASELYIDLYTVCVLLAVIPLKVRKWIRALIYLVVYPTFIVDIYCFTRFGTSISPTMLLLVGETNAGEASEFLSSYLNWDILSTDVGIVVEIALIHLAVNVVWVLRRLRPVRDHLNWLRDGIRLIRLRLGVLWYWLTPVLGILVISFFVSGISDRWDNKVAFHRLMSHKTVGKIEHELTRKDKAELYSPIYRLWFSIHANRLAAQQVSTLLAAKDHIAIDTCTFKSKNIVLIIGESYNRHHAQLYGYGKETTPHQVRRARRGELYAFTDVVSPWNLTSFVFKNLLSMHCVGDSGEWCDYPLFPEVFKKAGYKVTFITNQFITKAKEPVYDFSGGFFINNPQLSNAMFDVRNGRMYRYDDGVVGCFDKIVEDSTIKVGGKDGENNLIILHLKGQHVRYLDRCPKQLRKFEYKDYDIPSLDKRSLLILADYDNAVRYNDFICNEIIKRFEKKDAIVIYVPDHGEECFGGGIKVFGRLHSANVDYRLAHEEFEIPFWIWCSKTYKRKHRDVYRRIIKSRRKPMMTDRLAHTLLYIAGIETDAYKEKYNILSPYYDESTPRILKGVADYDKLRKEVKE